MFDYLKPEKNYGVVGLALLIVGVAGFVILEVYYTLWLGQYQLASLFFWGAGFVGSILYIVDLIRKRTNT
ncbi:hypothetical protein [Alkalibacillus haloalkaliphilus]|uniref:hypothetical protein n=1 Tax=Alkalibacillus haloalkaliphilus TaxID=94136 RepID=UPI000305EA11|nr:hypothetical protein [Alkalibacillus haloalkaliphilus]